MRMKMIGYGKFRYAIKSGKSTQWPVIGGALQKNYISVYVAVTRIGSPIVWAYAGKLGELRMGGNNFSFERFDDLCTVPLSSLFAEVAGIFRSDPLKSRSIHAGDVIQNRHCEEPEGRRSNPLIFATEMDCFAALVIGPATSGRTRWLAMTPHESDLKSSCH